MPARNCDCSDCALWRRACRTVLPETVTQALARLGAEVEWPADVYAHERTSDRTSLRLKYYLVGQVLAGPQAFEDCASGRICRYRTLAEAEAHAAVNVYPARESNLPEPRYDGSGGDLIVVDFRLDVATQT